MGVGIMNDNANTKAPIKTKQGLWEEESKAPLEAIPKKILTQAHLNTVFSLGGKQVLRSGLEKYLTFGFSTWEWLESI